jgi:hypothetical protein
VGLLKLGGNLLVVPVKRLSQLTIDADKLWNRKGITSIAGLAAGIAKGDLLMHDGTRLIILHPGPIGTILTSAGPGSVVTWGHP